MVFDTNYSSGAGKMSEQFPEGFLWGTSTSAHQVEGSNFNSDHWLLEHVEPTVFVEPSGDACDQYHRYESDIAMLADLGFNTYRFSVEWARIEPEPGFFSRTELDHYRRVLEACHKYSISPVVTLHHAVPVPEDLASRCLSPGPRSLPRIVVLLRAAYRVALLIGWAHPISGATL